MNSVFHSTEKPFGLKTAYLLLFSPKTSQKKSFTASEIEILHFKFDQKNLSQNVFLSGAPTCAISCLFLVDACGIKEPDCYSHSFFSSRQTRIRRNFCSVCSTKRIPRKASKLVQGVPFQFFLFKQQPKPGETKWPLDF